MRTTASIFVVIVTLINSRAAAPGGLSMDTVTNAALLYYRAAWAESLPFEKREALEHGEVDLETHQYFKIHQDALDLIRAAGTKPVCDWGIEDVKGGAFGILGVMSRAGHILSDLPLDHLRYQSAISSNRFHADDILAVFHLAAHLKRQNALPGWALTRGTVVAKVLITASKHIGKIDDKSLAEVQSFIQKNPAVFKFQAGDILGSEAALIQDEIETFLKENPHAERNESFSEFLGQIGMNPNDSWTEHKSAEEILTTVKRDFAWLATVADTFNASERDELDKRMHSVSKTAREHPASERHIANLNPVWERCFSVSQKVSLFKIGIALILNEKYAIPPKAGDLPPGIEYKSLPTGFILRRANVIALGRPVELTFGGFSRKLPN